MVTSWPLSSGRGLLRARGGAVRCAGREAPGARGPIAGPAFAAEPSVTQLVTQGRLGLVFVTPPEGKKLR
jgi:hypothetical protein